MREILFRGKRETDNKWLYGFPYVTRKNAVKINWYCSEFGSMKTDEVDPETVGQYTGLTDKNGKRIFEGDIIRFEDDIGYVIYNGDDARFLVDSPNMYISMDYSNEFEVIGNIHDNPELLQKI